MRSRRLALPPRCGSMLSSRCSLKRYRGTWYLGTSVYYTFNRTPHDGTRQQDQVGWSEGGPHIVNQLTFVISVRERLQTHWHAVTVKIEINNFPNSEFIIVVHRELFTATKYFRVAAREHTLAAPGTTVTFADEPVPSESCGAPCRALYCASTSGRSPWGCGGISDFVRVTRQNSRRRSGQHGQPRAWPRSVTAPRLRVAAVEGRGLPPRRRRPAAARAAGAPPRGVREQCDAGREKAAAAASRTHAERTPRNTPKAAPRAASSPPRAERPAAARRRARPAARPRV